MRDPARIEAVLGMIRKYWYKYPDMRLMQLLICALGDGDHFHVEDTDLMKKLKETFEIDPHYQDTDTP